MSDNDQYKKTLEYTYKIQYSQLQKLYLEGIQELTKKYNKENLSKNQLMVFYETKQNELKNEFYNNIYVGSDSNKLNLVKQLVDGIKKTEQDLKENNINIPLDIKQNIDQKDIDDMIDDISKDILDQKLSEDMNKEVNKILAKYNYDLNNKECIDEVKKYIWSFNSAKEKNKPELTKLQKEIAKSVTKAIDKATNAILYKLKQDAKNQLPDFDGYIDTSKDYVNALKKVDIKKDILTNVQSNLKNGLNSIDSSINDVLGNFGLKVDLSGTFSDEIGVISKDITSVFDKYLDPVIKEQNKIIEIAEDHIKEAEELIAEYEAQVQNLINKWEQTAKDYIKQQEQKLVDTIISNINIKF